MRPNLRIEVLHNGRVLESEEGDLLHPWAHVESGDFIVPSAGEDSARYRVLSRLWSRERSNFHLHVLRIKVALAEDVPTREVRPPAELEWLTWARRLATEFDLFHGRTPKHLTIETAWNAGELRHALEKRIEERTQADAQAETIALRAKCEELAEVGIETLNRATKAESRVALLEAALQSIAEWNMPPTKDGKPYEWHFGSNGERDVIIGRAKAALERLTLELAVLRISKRDPLVGRIVSLRRQLEDARRMASQPPVPEWVVNDAAELGVRIGSRFFWLYKGRSLEYPDGKHDNGTPMLWRPVGKREFGECCLPVALDRMPNRYEVGEGWKPMGDPPVDTEDTPSDLTRTQLSDVFILLEAWDRWDGCSKASRAALRLRASLHEPPETAPPDERKAIGALGDHIDDMRCRADVADDPEEGIEGGSTVAEVLREEAEALENLLRLWPWPAPPDVIDAWCRLTAFGWFRTSDESEIVGSYLLCCKPFTYPKGIGSQ